MMMLIDENYRLRDARAQDDRQTIAQEGAGPVIGRGAGGMNVVKTPGRDDRQARAGGQDSYPQDCPKAQE